MSPTPQTSILLLGAGELGTAFLPYLTTLPSAHLTLGIRSPSSYTHLSTLYPSLSLAHVDLSSPSAQLASTFSQYDILISATGFAASPSSLLKLAHEVLAAGKIKEKDSKGNGKGRLWFFPWQWGVDYDTTGDGAGLMPLFSAQRDVRNLLREQAGQSNVKWTVVSTGIFMSFLFEAFWGIVEKTKEEEGEGKMVVRCLKDWEHKVTVTHVDDIGRVLARILAGDVEGTNGVLYVAGDTVSYGELAGIVGRVSGCSVEREEWTIPYLEGELARDPEDGIKKYRLVFARDGVWWGKEKTVNEKLGMDMMDVETFAGELFGK
jgi:hypothetical protein